MLWMGRKRKVKMLETGNGWKDATGSGCGGLDTDEMDGDATGCGDRMEEFGLDEGGGSGSGYGDENGGGYGGVMDEVEYDMYTADYVMLELMEKEDM